MYNTTADHPATKCWELAKKGELKKAAELFYGEPLKSRREWITTRLRGGDINNNFAESMGVVDMPLFKYWHELMGFPAAVLVDYRSCRQLRKQSGS